MRFRLCFLFLFLFQGLVFSQEKIGIGDLPAPETIEYLVNGNTDFERYANQFTASTYLMAFITEEAADHQANGNQEGYRESMELFKAYAQEWEKLLIKARQTLSPTELRQLLDDMDHLNWDMDHIEQYIRNLLGEMAGNPPEKTDPPIAGPDPDPTSDPGPGTVSACAFFPDKDEVTYTYVEPGLFGTQTNVVKYIHREYVELKGKTYRAYDKYVNGRSPETNQVLYVGCTDDGLIMGNEIYAFNKEVIGYESDITKIIDVWATPVYEVGMRPTGQFYLPTVIRPNLPIGEVWEEKNEMHGQLVTIKSSMAQKNVSLTVRGKTYEHVYAVEQEIWTQGGMTGHQKIGESTIFFAKDIGMVKTERKITILGSQLIMATELEGG